jgi:hypothetical protein
MMVGSGGYVLFCLSIGVIDAVERKMIASHLRAILQIPPKDAS